MNVSAISHQMMSVNDKNNEITFGNGQNNFANLIKKAADNQKKLNEIVLIPSASVLAAMAGISSAKNRVQELNMHKSVTEKNELMEQLQQEVQEYEENWKKETGITLDKNFNVSRICRSVTKVDGSKCINYYMRLALDQNGNIVDGMYRNHEDYSRRHPIMMKFPEDNINLSTSASPIKVPVTIKRNKKVNITMLDGDTYKVESGEKDGHSIVRITDKKHCGYIPKRRIEYGPDGEWISESTYEYYYPDSYKKVTTDTPEKHVEVFYAPASTVYMKKVQDKNTGKTVWCYKEPIPLFHEDDFADKGKYYTKVIEEISPEEYRCSFINTSNGKIKFSYNFKKDGTITNVCHYNQDGVKT